MGTKKGGSVVKTVWDLAQPVAQNLGLILWDVRYLKEGSDWHLHIYLDKENGISIEDCEKFYRIFDPILDEADPIDHHYQLEIESPGIERSLTRDFHYEMCKDEMVKVNLIRPDEYSKRSYIGNLIGLDNGMVIIKTDDKQLSFDKKTISSVCLIFNDNDFKDLN